MTTRPSDSLTNAKSQHVCRHRTVWIEPALAPLHRDASPHKVDAFSTVYLVTAMSLNIKNDETCQLAGDLARLTGETMTGAITIALRERLDRERRARSASQRLREMRVIADRCARVLKPGPSAVEHGELLYDQRGLPH